MKMKDYHAISSLKSTDFETMSVLITIIGRISNYSEEELWDMELEEYNKVQEAFMEAMDNIIKKANAGNSTSS
jgi:prolipoprotein diacylglyceryltransferase